jgi:hypothetical protein
MVMIMTSATAHLGYSGGIFFRKTQQEKTGWHGMGEK